MNCLSDPNRLPNTGMLFLLFTCLLSQTVNCIVDWLIYGSSAKRSFNERKSEQAHIPHAPTLLENAVYNEWQFIASISDVQSEKKGDINCSSEGSNQHFL